MSQEAASGRRRLPVRDRRSDARQGLRGQSLLQDCIRGMGSRGLDKRGEASTIYWLIVKRDGPGTRVFTTRFTCSEESLPIFGHAEEAGTFLRLGKLENGWLVRGTGVGELVSVLLGPCANVRTVALDPMPTTDADAGVLASLVSMGRESFMEILSSNLRLEK